MIRIPHIPTITADDKWVYDEARATVPERFAEKYVVHYEGEQAGKPFIFLDWQREASRAFYGWINRKTGAQRFNTLFLLIGKGNGKSPFLTVLGLCELFVANRKGACIFSGATNIEQANITFHGGKAYIKESPQLNERAKVTTYEIRRPEKNAVWKAITGSASGKQGFKPDVFIGDEIHEWKGYDFWNAVTVNLIKRKHSTMILATNAGKNQQCLAWDLYKQGRAILEGHAPLDRFLPVIYTTDPSDDPWAEETWRAANPALGVTLDMDRFRDEVEAAKRDPTREAVFRRYNLSQFFGSAAKWIPLPQIDAATLPKGAKVKGVSKNTPLFVGLDLSLVDDFSAIAFLWPGEKRWYLRVKTFATAQAVKKYEKQLGSSLKAWQEGGFLTILNTKNLAESKVYPKIIKKYGAKYDIKAIGYDPAFATLTIKRLEKEGFACVPVSQKITNIGQPTLELERRINDGTLVIQNDPCFRWQLSNCEVIKDNNGLVRLAKTHATKTHAGSSQEKIDAPAASVNAIYCAMRHRMGEDEDDAAPYDKPWNGEIIVM